MKIEYLGKDQDWQNETTRYWFRLEGTDYGTGIEFESDEFAVAESSNNVQLLDADGAPLVETDGLAIAVARNTYVTDVMRLDD